MKGSLYQLAIQGNGCDYHSRRSSQGNVVNTPEANFPLSPTCDLFLLRRPDSLCDPSPSTARDRVLALLVVTDKKLLSRKVFAHFC